MIRFAHGGRPPRLWWVVALLACCLNLGAHAADLHTFWSVKGAHNTVYLLGSVHVLKPSDSDLPPAALSAYAKAKALVMEVDLNDAAADSLMESGLSLEMLPEGQTLAAVLGPEAYGRFVAHVKALGLEPDMFSTFQPWFAAVALEQQELTQQGFDASAGVDEQFAQRAAADQKPIIALETVDQQLGFFAHLTNDEQRRFLLYTLDDADDTTNGADAVVAAWRSGDVAKLESLLGQSYAQYPELFRMLTTDRNRRWLPKITQLLHEDQDYLVIVGALHLVGHDGLIALLEQAGYSAVQH
ncbi:MAG TPA: TraB/GumN family protein [Steroidobacteraceae bacterium]